MIIILSPSKDMLPRNCQNLDGNLPQFLDATKKIVKNLRKLSVADIELKMKVSNKLALINHERICNLAVGRYKGTHAIATYTGNVYAGLDVTTILASDLENYQDNIMILSALYGILRPLDYILPYRLEMQISSFSIGKSASLYQYWSQTLTKFTIKKLGKEALINLASDEYSKVILPSLPTDQIINISFRELKDGKPVFISAFAKKARGLMTRYAILNKIKSPSKLKDFNLEGYRFDKDLSTKNDWFFVR